MINYGRMFIEFKMDFKNYEKAVDKICRVMYYIKVSIYRSISSAGRALDF